MDMFPHPPKFMRSDPFVHWFVLLGENVQIVVPDTWRSVKYDVIAIDFLNLDKIWHLVFNDKREALKIILSIDNMDQLYAVTFQ